MIAIPQPPSATSGGRVEIGFDKACGGFALDLQAQRLRSLQCCLTGQPLTLGQVHQNERAGPSAADGPPSEVLTDDTIARVFGITAHLSNGPDGLVFQALDVIDP